MIRVTCISSHTPSSFISTYSIWCCTKRVSTRSLFFRVGKWLLAMHYRVFSIIKLINSLIVCSEVNSLWLLLWKFAIRFGVGLHKGYLGLQKIKKLLWNWTIFKKTYYTVLQYVDELSESKFVICSFIFSKVKLKNIQLCFTLSLGFSLLLK